MCISNGTGPDMISRMFRKPMGMLITPVGSMHCGSQNINGIFSHYCLNTNKKLNLEQIHNKGLINALFTNNFKEKDVSLIKNNPQYYRDFGMFCIDFLENKFDKENLKKQQKNFWIKLKKYSGRKGKFNSVLFPPNLKELIN